MPRSYFFKSRCESRCVAIEALDLFIQSKNYTLLDIKGAMVMLFNFLCVEIEINLFLWLVFEVNNVYINICLFNK